MNFFQITCLHAAKPHRRKTDSQADIRLVLAFGLLSLTALALSLYATSPVPSNKPAAYPAWWFTRDVIPRLDTNNASPTWTSSYHPPSDFNAINQGQLKYIAKRAYEELNENLPGGGSADLDDLIQSFSTTNGNYNAVNLGQLKTVAKPFYDRLIQAGYATNYPWSSSPNAPHDFAAANIGQVKNVFNFDVTVDVLPGPGGNGLPDWWEMHYFGQTGVDPDADPDGDGFSNLEEYLGGFDPHDFYNGFMPSLQITNGGDQRGTPNHFLPQPLVVQVNGGLLNAPLTFTVTQGGAKISLTNTGTPTATTLPLTTDSTTGNATVYIFLPNTVTDASVITVTATYGSAPNVQTATLTTTASCMDSSVAAPTGLTVTPTSPTTADLSWTNHSSNGTTIQQSTDGGATWQTIAIVGVDVNSYTATELTPDVSVLFQTFANASGGGSGGGSSSAPAPAVTPLGQPQIVGEQLSATRFKMGFNTFVTTSPPKEYLTESWQGHGFDHDNNQLASGTRLQQVDPLTGDITTTITGIWDSIINDSLTHTTTATSIVTTGIFNPGNILEGDDIELSDEYTTAELKLDTISALPAPQNDFQNNVKTASVTLSSDELSYSLTKLRYKFKVNASPAIALDWLEVFMPENGSSPIITAMNWTGASVTETPVYTIDPSALNGGKNGTYTILQAVLSCPEADSTVFPAKDGIFPDKNPAYFIKANPPDPTLSKSNEPALVILYKDVINSSFVVQPFTVDLYFDPELSQTTWTKVKGPAGVGTLQNANSANAQFMNPNAGGLFQFDGIAGAGAQNIRTSLILPLAGAEIKDVVSSDIVKADAFAAKVLATYNPIEINLWPSNGVRWFFTNGAGDYLGRPDNQNSKTCVRFNSVNDTTGMGAVATWFGVPVKIAKASNFLVGYACKKIGVWDVNAYLAQNIGTSNDASATASFNFGEAVASGTKNYSTDTVTMLQANFYNSDDKNTRLWPNAQAADNHISSSVITDFNTQFCSPGFTEMTSP